MMETKALVATLKDAGFAACQIAVLLADLTRCEAALGLIKAGRRADDGETDWPAALVLTCLQPAIWAGYSPVPTPVAEVTERFAAVRQRTADQPDQPRAVYDLLREVCQRAPGGIEVALWGKHRGILTDLLKELEDLVD